MGSRLLVSLTTVFVLLNVICTAGALQSQLVVPNSGTITYSSSLAFETSFEDVTKINEHFVFPGYPQYPSTTNGFVYGTATGQSWIETGFAYTGTKCAGFRRNLASDRIEWNVWSLDQWVGQEAFVSEWMFLPVGFDTPNGWDCLAVAFSDGGTGCPYAEIHVYRSASTGNSFGAYFGYRDVNGNYFQKSIVLLDELPIGRWFPIQWHVFRDARDGLVEAWINSQYPDPPTLTFRGATKGSNDYWYISPAKCYGNQVSAAGHTLWIDDLKIYCRLSASA